MSDDERVEQLAATLRLLLGAAEKRSVIWRALKAVLPDWTIGVPDYPEYMNEIVERMRKEPFLDPREVAQLRRMAGLDR